MKLTKGDYKKIENEIERKKNELGPELREKLKEARAQGDLSENFEYTMAKRENNQNLSRIAYLENVLKGAEIIETDPADETAGIDKTVTFYHEALKREISFSIVTFFRVDAKKSLISEVSPIGKALMGHKAGDRVKVTLDNGTSYFVQIRKVSDATDIGLDTLTL